MSKPLELVGQVFGKLTVIQRADKTSTGNWKWLCMCSCGLLPLAALGALVVSASAAPLQLITVNANGLCMDKAYKDRGWAQRPMLDLVVQPNQYPAELGTPAQAFLAAVEHHQTKEVGTYLSGSRCQPTAELTHYPRAAVACERFAADALLPSGLCPNCRHIDFRIPAERDKFIAAATAELDARRPGRVLVDNIFNRRTAPYPVPFADVCAVLAALRAPQREIIANIANQSWHWPQEELDLLAASTDGSAWEVPWHPSIRGNGESMQKQVAVYRNWLAAGETLVFMAVMTNADDAARAAEAEYVAALTQIVQEPKQQAYFAWVFQAVNPTWPWLQAGEALGPVQIAADGAVSRRFAGGTLTVSAPRTVTFFAPEAPASEPITAAVPKPLSRAVADGDLEMIRVTTSGTLAAPLLLKTGQKITCDAGVQITCQYAEPRPCIVLADNCAVQNCTLLGKWMGPSDAPISHESFHGIGCYGAQNVTIDSVVAEGFYGDGFYAGPKTLTDRTPCTFTVKASAFRSNVRQGASVVSGVGTFEDCLFALTKGKSPQAGIDLEPSHAQDIVQVRLSNCVSDANWGSPYLVNLDRVAATSPPPRVSFSGCKAVNTPPHQWTELRLAGINDSPSGSLPKGTLVEWDGLKLVKVP